MWLEDGQQVSLWGFSGVAVGWLERGHPYRTGVTPENVVDRLAELLTDMAWNPVHYLGSHSCDLGSCGFRSRVGSSVSDLSSKLIPYRFGNLAEQIRRRAKEEVQRDAVIRKALARHHRRHASENPAMQPKKSGMWKSLRYKAELWRAQAIDMLAKGFRSGVRSAARTIDPYPFP